MVLAAEMLVLTNQKGTQKAPIVQSGATDSLTIWTQPGSSLRILLRVATRSSRILSPRPRTKSSNVYLHKGAPRPGTGSGSRLWSPREASKAGRRAIMTLVHHVGITKHTSSLLFPMKHRQPGAC